jgi:hypothetical protein
VQDQLEDGAHENNTGSTGSYATAVLVDAKLPPCSSRVGPATTSLDGGGADGAASCPIAR